jgi:site-specific recombinase XerD
MLLSEAIRDFAAYARTELGHTPATIITYASRQRHFARWLAGRGLAAPVVSEVTPDLIRRYQYALSAQNLRPRSIRGSLNALRALFAYLASMGDASTNPALEVKLPKKDDAHRLLVTDDDLVRLLQACERQRTEFRSVRDKAILAVLIYCGVRRQELLNLTVPAINMADGSLLVQHGKGKKSRVIPLCVEAKGAVQEWPALRQMRKCPHGWLFITEARRRLGERGLSHLLEDVKAIAGLKGDPRVKPHSIRHAAATRLLRNGADICSIKVWLGHAHLQTTAIHLPATRERREGGPVSWTGAWVTQHKMAGRIARRHGKGIRAWLPKRARPLLAAPDYCAARLRGLRPIPVK